jgi:hypothetical protein
MLPVPNQPIEFVVARLNNADLNGDTEQDLFNHIGEGFLVLDDQRRRDVRALRNEQRDVVRNVDEIRGQVVELQDGQRRLGNDVVDLQNRARDVQQQNAAIVVPAAPPTPALNLNQINQIVVRFNAENEKKAVEKRNNEIEANRIRACFSATINSCDNYIALFDSFTLIVQLPRIGVPTGALLILPLAALEIGSAATVLPVLLLPTAVLEVGVLAKVFFSKRKKTFTLEQRRRFEDYLQQNLTHKLALEFAKKV